MIRLDTGNALGHGIDPHLDREIFLEVGMVGGAGDFPVSAILEFGNFDEETTPTKVLKSFLGLILPTRSRTGTVKAPLASTASWIPFPPNTKTASPGSTRLAAAMAEERIRPRASIPNRASFASWLATVADELLVTAVGAHEGTVIVAVDPATEGVAITRHRSKVAVPLASIEFIDVLVPSERLVNQGDDAAAAIGTALQTGSLLATAEAVGMCEALITLTSEYVSRRHAFGRPIGAFQAVAHPCADMRVSADAVRILVQQAAWLVDNGQNADEEIPATKALANEHFERVANDAYRLHGALGFSAECDVQLFMRRLHGFFGSFGETQESFERAAAALGM